MKNNTNTTNSKYQDTFWNHLFSDKQVREMDAQMIRNGMPSQTLMELAGHQCAVHIHEWVSRNHNIVILCGGGNNGGDGYVIARWLHIWGHNVVLCPIAEPKTTDAKINAERCHKLQIPIQDWIDIGYIFEKYNDLVVIESVLGTGQNRRIEGTFADVCDTLYEQNGPIISIDTPLGLGHGQICYDKPVDPDLCFNIGASKWTLYTGHITGEIRNIDIGFSQLEYKSKYKKIQESILQFYPRSSVREAKWDKGHVAILAKKGAAVLAAHSALASGAGLVTLLVEEEDLPYLIGLRPEIILARPDQLDPKRHDALIVGPAFGFSHTERIIELWETFPNPALFDADALRTINKKPSKFPRVITPHTAEAAALIGVSRKDVEARPYLYLQKLSELGICVLKGHQSKISNGADIFVNVLHAPKLATAGSGDVLCGVIGALLSKGVSPLTSSVLGVYLHAKAGRYLKFGDGSSRIIDHIQSILDDLP